MGARNVQILTIFRDRAARHLYTLSLQFRSQILIRPGLAWVLLGNQFAHAALQQRQRQLVDSVALKRLGTADEIAKAVMFFASDLASFVNGQVLSVDGGK